MKPLTTPLTDPEVDQLARFLGRVVGGEIANIEAFDGFVTALAVCPVLIPPSEFLPVLQSGASEAGDLVFDDSAEAQAFVGLVMRHWNTVNATLSRDEPYMPILLEGADGVARCNDWARGFTRGMRLRPAVWSDVVNDDKRGGGIVAIFALAHEHDADPELRPYDEPITPERREQLQVGMIAGVLQLYRAFAPERRAAARGIAANPFPAAPKVGRNAPCPCGSGKKFKKCCGGVTLH